MQTFKTTTQLSNHPVPAHRRFGRISRFAALFAILILAACEAPTEVEPGVITAQDATFYGLSAAKTSPSAVAVDPDGTLRPLLEDEEDVVLGVDHNTDVEVVIAGRATYGSGNVSMLRLSVRQTADGTTSGGGAVAIFGTEVGVTAECIKPLTSFGRTFYGVNVEFAEPVVRTTPWGTVTYTHGALSVADGGDLANLVLASSSGCYAAALLYPYEPQTGKINVNLPE